MRRMNTHRWIATLLLAVCALTWGAASQDTGFEVIYEGYADEEEAAAIDLDIALYANAGFSGAGAVWATAGGRAAFSVDGFGIHVDASGGTNGMQVQGGVTTEIAGFGLAGDVIWSPGATTVINLRGWGTLGTFQVSGNARIAGNNTSFSVGAGTDFEGFGLSANLGFGGAGVSEASVGANLSLGDATVSASAGLVSGRFNAGGGIGLTVGPANVTASVGFDAEIGLNAMAGGSVAWEEFQATAIALFDNTGFGGEVSSEIGLGNLTATFMGRLAGSSISLEVGGRLPLGSAIVSVSVALDTQGGLSWAEVGFELPF